MQPATEKKDVSSEEYLDDITYISEIKQIPGVHGVWQQYDILIAARGYGWAYMVNSADYLTTADLEDISQVESGELFLMHRDLTDAFRKNGGKVTGIPESENESGFLSVAGMSKTLHEPVKIVWINQTRILRIFSLTDDVPLIERYAETIIRRTFGTKDAMKRGKPLPENRSSD